MNADPGTAPGPGTTPDPGTAPAPGTSPAPRGDSRFDTIARSVLIRRFFGVPFFRPAVSPALLFDSWAFLFGPLPFLFSGMWRKGLVLLLAGLFLYAPLFLPTDTSALTAAFTEAYTPYPQLLAGLSLLLVLCAGSGRLPAALLTISAISAVFLYGLLHVEHLYLGERHGMAYVWLCTAPVWKSLFQLLVLGALGLRPILLLATTLAAAGLFLLGIPLNIPVASLPAAAFPVFCAMMATYDRFRRNVRGETFWW